ncbi:hypothetical protein, partial [Moorena sp. SIO3I8]|uniref:hypothetical protein n=1 Tax=Moorena sp. SIO3I8 TaxID=2607833 RepID=UPI0025D23092
YTRFIELLHIPEFNLILGLLTLGFSRAYTVLKCKFFKLIISSKEGVKNVYSEILRKFEFSNY